MIKECGEVVSLEQNFVWIKTIRQTTCGSCHSRNGCGQKLLNQYSATTADIKAKLGPDIDAGRIAPGDQVEIGIEESAVVLSSMLTYGLPIVALVLGVALTASMASDFVAACVGFTSFILGAAFVRWFFPLYAYSQLFEPVVLSIQSKDGVQVNAETIAVSAS